MCVRVGKSFCGWTHFPVKFGFYTFQRLLRKCCMLSYVPTLFLYMRPLEKGFDGHQRAILQLMCVFVCACVSLLYFYSITHKLRQIARPCSELWRISRFLDDLLSAFVFLRISEGEHEDWTELNFGFKHVYRMLYYTAKNVCWSSVQWKFFILLLTQIYFLSHASKRCLLMVFTCLCSVLCLLLHVFLSTFV